MEPDAAHLEGNVTFDHLTTKSLAAALENLNIPRACPVIAHASLSSFGYVQGGANTLVQALASTFDAFIMPTFTYKTMLIPEIGPTENGLNYGSGKDVNRMAQFFDPNMPADRLMGATSEALRCHPKAQRSSHPILSFAGIHAAAILSSQNLTEPLAPIRVLHEMNGWVLLLGVDQTVNTSIHYIEKIAGRKQFIRWALTTQGVIECPGFPGCSDGFEAITPRLDGVIRQTTAGMTLIQAIPLIELMHTVYTWLKADPLALLCNRSYCERCATVRQQTPTR